MEVLDGLLDEEGVVTAEGGLLADSIGAAVAVVEAFKALPSVGREAINGYVTVGSWRIDLRGGGGGGGGTIDGVTTGTSLLADGVVATGFSSMLRRTDQLLPVPRMA